MSKKIKRIESKVEIFEGNVDIIEINGISFEKDWRYPWIDIYSIENEGKYHIEKIDEEEDNPIIDSDDLRIFALNWYFNNVEIVKEIN